LRRDSRLAGWTVVGTSTPLLLLRDVLPVLVSVSGWEVAVLAVVQALPVAARLRAEPRRCVWSETGA